MKDLGILFLLMIPFGTVFLIGAYLNIWRKLKPMLWEWLGSLRKGNFDPKSFVNALIYEVLLIRRIYRQSKFRWARHMLIFWGLGVLILFDIFSSLFLKAFPLQALLAVRETAMEVVFNLLGIILLVGLVIALIGFYVYRRSEDKIYYSPIMTTLILIATISGFLAEAFELASTPYDPIMEYTLLGNWIASYLRTVGVDWSAVYSFASPLHIVLSGVAFAYVPFDKGIHMLITTIGRLMNSQGAAWKGKIRGVLEGLTESG